MPRFPFTFLHRLFRFLLPSALLVTALLAGEPPRTSGSSSDQRIDRYSLEHYLTDIAEQQWQARSKQLAALKTSADVTARGKFIRTEFIKAIGGFPEARTPLNARITGTVEREGYRIENLVYESMPGLFVTANVYVPTTGPGPFPAILGTSGHSGAAGKAYPVYQTAFIALAQRGYIVIAYDTPLQGERTEYVTDKAGKKKSLPHISPGLQCLLTGGTVARYFLWDGMRAVDYLLTRADVDPKRIGATGNSGGGTQSAFLAVVEPRLAAVASSCYWTSWETLWRLPNGGPQDSEQVVPNFIKNGLGFSDLAIAFAPKPIEMLTATKDMFPILGARATYEEAKSAFALLGAADRAGYFEFDDGHGWSKPRREATAGWFNKWFYGRNDPVTEPDIKPEDPNVLQTTTTGDIVTALQSKTIQGVNQELAERIYPQRQLRKINNPAKARGVVAARLAIATKRTSPTAKVIEQKTQTKYAHEKVELVPEPGIRLAADIFTPVRAAQPARTIILIREGAAASEPEKDADVAAWLEAGHVVVSAELRGRLIQPIKPAGYYTEQYRTAMRAILVGRTVPGMRVQDILAVYDYVAARKGVDPKRVTLVGKGNNGVIALYAAALEPRIQRVALDRSLLSYMDMVRAKEYPESLVDVVVPGVLLDFDLPDLIGLVGAEKVVLINPTSPMGEAVSVQTAQTQYPSKVKVVVDASASTSRLLN